MSRQDEITQTLKQALNPVYLNVENESSAHHVPKGAETHFKILLVSQAFQGMTRLARHQTLYHLLEKELKEGLHALSMRLYTVEEWEKSNKTVEASPACQGGLHREHMNKG